MNQSISVFLYSNKVKVLFFLMGMLCFSTLGSTITQSYLHLPLSLPELFFVPLYLVLKKDILPIRMDGKTFGHLFFLLIVLIFISQIVGDYSLFAVLSSSRGYLYLFLFYSIYRINTFYDEELLIIVLLGSIVGWFISSFGNFRVVVLTEDTFQNYGNMIAVALFILFTVLRKEWGSFLVGFAMILGICVFSGVRRITLVVFIAFALAAILQMLLYTKSIIKELVLISLVVVPLIIFIPRFGSKLEAISPVLYFRLYEKTELTLSGESSISDDYRRANINKFFDNTEEYLLPRGMVSNQYLKDDGAGIFMDFPLIALSRIFSFPIAVIMVSFFLIRGLKCFFYFRRTKNVSAAVYSATGVIFFVLLFVEGSFLVYPFVTPFTGLCLGRIVFYSRQYDSLKNNTKRVAPIYYQQ